MRASEERNAARERIISRLRNYNYPWRYKNREAEVEEMNGILRRRELDIVALL